MSSPKRKKKGVSPMDSKAVRVIMFLVMVECGFFSLYGFSYHFPEFKELSHKEGTAWKASRFVEGRSGNDGLAITFIGDEKRYSCIPQGQLEQNHTSYEALKTELEDALKVAHPHLDIWYFAPHLLDRDCDRVAQLAVNGNMVIPYEAQRDIIKGAHWRGGWIFLLAFAFMFTLWHKARKARRKKL